MIISSSVLRKEILNKQYLQSDPLRLTALIIGCLTLPKTHPKNMCSANGKATFNLNLEYPKEVLAEERAN